MHAADTIAAISNSVAAAAGRMIVRMSGAEARRIAASVSDDLPPAGEARRTGLSFSDLTVPAWIYFFAAPRSYTGEDLVEFHLPGNPLLVKMLLDALIAAGARHAEPGEFTARAYFSGRIDLAEAEGVAATIAAHGDAELRAARQLLAGELSSRLRGPMESLAEALALVEAGIDFSEEDISFLAGDELVRRVEEIDAFLDDLVKNSARFEPLTHEPSFVLVGRPNAGKSTLLNALAGHDRAIVSPIAGTTRDALSAEVRLKRGLVRLIDVAGLDEDLAAPDAIEHQMNAQARRVIESADFVLLVRDASDDKPLFELPRRADLIVLTKADLASAALPGAISAVTGQGLDAFRDALDVLAFGQVAAAPTLALNARHLAAIADARSALARAKEIARTAGAELIALELRDALDSLGRVLGQVTPDDVLGRVFATFCIGK
ncbi:MAG: tRNA modification GTPase [Phycisphaerales bacterium]|jgi:tRNA modification GTPase|nr:tRNA modification GTPase [Phycisphaerales bacterium]